MIVPMLGAPRYAQAGLDTDRAYAPRGYAARDALRHKWLRLWSQGAERMAQITLLPLANQTPPSTTVSALRASSSCTSEAWRAARASRFWIAVRMAL